MEYNEKTLPFLDILLIKEGAKIMTDLYCKETDTHQYLDFRCCHPSHSKRNIPFNMARRICAIVTDGNTLAKRLQELRVYLSEKSHLLGNQQSKRYPISTLRNVRCRKNNDLDNIPFVVTHNQRNHNILYAAKRFFPILEQ